MTNTPKRGLTTLEKEIYYFVAIVVSIMLFMIVVVITVWAAWLRHSHPDWINVPTLIVDCVSVAVAFIPEGLPIAVTASLTIVAAVMKRNKILCKSLKTVETLGAVSVICSDKTGTLTKNRMTVTNCFVDSESMSANAAAGIIELDQDHSSRVPPLAKSLKELARAAALCNAAEFDAATNALPVDQRRVLGDATDVAILRFAETLRSVSFTRQQWKQVYRIPFNSKDKYMVHIAENAGTEDESIAFGDKVLYIKGAPDILMPRCSHYLTSEGGSRALDGQHRVFIEGIKDNWSREAKRVILLARKRLSEKTTCLDKRSREFEEAITQEIGWGLEFVGMVGLVDPPRDEIPEIIRILRGAGIRVHMVTGDFKLTAQAIAAQCGIITQPVAIIDDVNALSRGCSHTSMTGIAIAGEEQLETNSRSKSAIIISGADLPNLDDQQWDRLCAYDEIVFARTTPEQKLRIVKELQARGETIGMTGDGVNDAPSLKAADVGIAMGSGSDIAVEAADMVLLDSFAGIVEAVRYGRVVFDNLKKTVCYLLPAGSFSEFWPVFTSVIFGLPQILSSFLMIIICCFTDCAAAIAIAYEKPEADVMLRPPRNPRKDRLVDWKLILHAYGFIGVIETTVSFSMSYWFLQRSGAPFSQLWFGFGNVPNGLSGATYQNLLNTASSVYFVNLVVMQFFNLMAVRTRRLSVLAHPPIFRRATRNLYLFPAVVFAIAIAFFFNYIPRFQSVLDTAQVPVAHWFLPVGFGLGLLLLDEVRKWVVRKWPSGPLAKIAW